MAVAEENDTVGKREAEINKSVAHARFLSVNTRKADDRITDKSSEELIAAASADTVETETVGEQAAESPVQAKESTAVKNSLCRPEPLWRKNLLRQKRNQSHENGDLEWAPEVFLPGTAVR